MREAGDGDEWRWGELNVRWTSRWPPFKLFCKWNGAHEHLLSPQMMRKTFGEILKVKIPCHGPWSADRNMWLRRGGLYAPHYSIPQFRDVFNFVGRNRTVRIIGKEKETKGGDAFE